MSPSLLILQPTPYCNLDCSYCYLAHRDDRRRMSDEVLRNVAHRILAPCSVDHLPAILWHAGEPMTLPPSWYDNAFKLLEEESGHTGLKHVFQTNAVGVTEAWTSLWKTWRVEIGVSIDGPADLHDRNRKTRAGRGTHRLTLNGIRKIQCEGLNVSVISVLGAQGLASPDELVDFFLAEDLQNVGFNVEEIEGQDTESSLLGLTDVKDAYYVFLRRVMQRSLHADSAFGCREVEFLRELFARPHGQRSQNGQVVPFDVVTVCVDGGLSTFSPELAGVEAPQFDNFIFGNVTTGGVEQMTSNPAFQAAKAAIDKGVSACANQCAYFEICGGGAPSNKFFELNDLAGTETLYCQLNVQAAVNAVLDEVEAQTVDQSELWRKVQ
ncbi:MAG: cyclophane-forming radical SAM/SPASM peptide maturase GrrM/OscB [Roseobacter sp.]